MLSELCNIYEIIHKAIMPLCPFEHYLFPTILIVLWTYFLWFHLNTNLVLSSTMFHVFDLLCFMVPILVHIIIFIGVVVDGLDGYNIFGLNGQNNHVHEDLDIQEVPQPAKGNGVPPRLNWTPVMSSFVLNTFSDLVATGWGQAWASRTTTPMLLQKKCSYIGQPVSRTQVYNHLHKWHTKWVKIYKLRDLSAVGGLGWGLMQDYNGCWASPWPCEGMNFNLFH